LLREVRALLPEPLALLRELLDLVRVPPLFFLRDCPDSDIAMAIACLRLFTFFPEPLASFPSLCSRITRETLLFCFAVAMTISSSMQDLIR
jgi:hypothetical protein